MKKRAKNNRDGIAFLTRMGIWAMRALTVFAAVGVFSSAATRAGDYLVGATGANLSVTMEGQTGWNLAITVPPGINGLVPNIGVAYSGDGANGSVGLGAKVVGFSGISRCITTIAPSPE